MRRREFITLLGGGAATWPLAARAQERVRLIGVLTSGTIADNPDTQARMAAFLQGLQHLGWADGRNVRIVYRSGLGDADNTHKYAAELAALAPDVILTTGTTTVAPMLQATRTVPIVFVAVADPVGAGFVDSLSRPGGNATGFMIGAYRAPSHHGYQRACDLISGQASNGPLGSPVFESTGKTDAPAAAPFHLPLADLGR